MDFETSRQFDKLVFRTRDKVIKSRLKSIIEKVAETQSIDEIPNITQIVGHPGFYRIRVGDYRIGISLEEDTIWFLYFGKRDESIYKKFP